MQANFERLLPEILKHEGGFVDHPRDPGGATNKGITIGTYRAHVNSSGTVDDLRALTEDQAGVVYRAQYWDKVRADELPSGVDYAMFDFAVNSGPGRAARYAQRIAGVTEDGAVGPITVAAIQRINPADFIEELCDMRLTFMRQIRNGSLWKTFGRGWQRRVDEVRALSLELTYDAAPTTPIDDPDCFDFIVDEPVQRVGRRHVVQALALDEDLPPEDGKNRNSFFESTTLQATVRNFMAKLPLYGASAWTAFQQQDPMVQAAAFIALALVFYIATRADIHVVKERWVKWFEKGIR